MNRRLATGACILMLTASGLAAHADSGAGQVRGAVLDRAGRPIAAARVDITCGYFRRRVQSNNIGEFAVRNLPEGTCTAAASKGGATSVTVTFDVRGDGSPDLVLWLQGQPFAYGVVVTPSRGQAESVHGVPESVTVTSRDELDRRPFTLLGQALREQPGVMLQQTTTAQVSPIIRGFTGQGNIYLIDGVRLNVSTWRSGPSQYFAWVNSHAVESMEVVRGSGSLQYGSDALGGTIQLMPSRPALRSEAGVSFGGVVDVTGASADRMGAVHASGWVESSVASIKAGFDTATVGDLRAGGGADSHAAVTRFLGLAGQPPEGRLPGTGYRQRGGYVNAVVRIGHAGALFGTYLAQTQSGVNRYDRLAGGDGRYRSGFEPQRLDLAVVRYESSNAGIFDRWTAAVSLNRQEDGRFEQSRPVSRLDRQTAVTTAVGYQAQAGRFWGSRHQVTAGVEVYDESIQAARTLVEVNGATAAARPDVPDGTTYTTTGAFVQQVSELVGDRLWLRGGARYSRFSFTSVADSALGVVDERVAAGAVTFQGGAVWALSSHLNATMNVSRGFRAGNAADFGGIGLTGGGGFEISPGRARDFGAFVGTNEGPTAVTTGRLVGALAPETATTFEAALKVHSGRVMASVAAYDMELRDTIQRRTIIVDQPVVGASVAGFQIVSQDAEGRVFIAEDSRPLVTRVNLDRGRVLGVDAEASVRIAEAWTAAGYVSVSDGRVLGGDYLRRMPPPLGGASLRWNGAGGRAWAEGTATWARPQTRLNAGDRSDARIGGARTAGSIASYFNGRAIDLGLVAGGRLVATGESLAEVQARLLDGQSSSFLFSETPGFVAVGLRAGWKFSEVLSAVLIGENLLDRNYRIHGSGVDAPGRNLQLRLRYRF